MKTTIPSLLLLALSTSCAVDQSNTDPADQNQQEKPYNTYSCSPGDNITSVLAKECCDTFSKTQSDAQNGTHYQLFIHPTISNLTVQRNGAGYGGCRTSSGNPSCGGFNCFYGPQGYARATFQSTNSRHVNSVAGGYVGN